MGVRRSWAMALDTCRTPSINRPMRSSMSLMTSASWSNSSPEPERLTRCAKSPAAMAAAVAETLAMVRRNRLRTMMAPIVAMAMTITTAQISASVSRLPNCTRTCTSRPDQQLVAVRQVVAVHQRQRAHPRAADLELPPLAGLLDHRGPRVQVARHPRHRGIDQQIDRVVVHVGGEAVLDRADQVRTRPPSSKRSINPWASARIAEAVWRSSRPAVNHQRNEARAAALIVRRIA